MSIDAIGSDKCQINFTTPTVQALYKHTEDKHLAEIAELKSQVEDLQEELRETRTQSNLKDWEIRFLKEDVKRLSAKRDEKCHYLQTEDTED